AVIVTVEAAIAAIVAGIGIAAAPAVLAATIVAPAVIAAIGVTPALAAIPGLLAIVALLVDFVAFAISHAVDASALLRRHHTIGAGASLCTIDRPLSLLEAAGLAAGDLAVANAPLDAVLLVVLALIDGSHRLRIG